MTAIDLGNEVHKLKQDYTILNLCIGAYSSELSKTGCQELHKLTNLKV